MDFKKSIKIPTKVSAVIFFLALISIIYVVYVFNSDAVRNSAKQSEVANEATRKIEEMTEKRKGYSDCLLDALKEVNTFKEDNSGVAEAAIKNMVDRSTKVCDEKYPEFAPKD